MDKKIEDIFVFKKVKRFSIERAHPQPKPTDIFAFEKLLCRFSAH